MDVRRSRSRLPEAIRSLRPPSPYELATQRIVQEGRKERQRRQAEWTRRTHPWLADGGEDALTS
jgi:hypothetical protein